MAYSELVDAGRAKDSCYFDKVWDVLRRFLMQWAPWTWVLAVVLRCGSCLGEFTIAPGYYFCPPPFPHVLDISLPNLCSRCLPDFLSFARPCCPSFRLAYVAPSVPLFRALLVVADAVAARVGSWHDGLLTSGRVGAVDTLRALVLILGVACFCYLYPLFGASR